MLIDKDELSESALRGLAEQHVLTFSNPDEVSPDFARWVEQVLSKIKTGELLIEFSEHHQSVRLIDADGCG